MGASGGPVHFVATTHSSGDNSYQGGVEIQKSVAVWRDGESDEVEVRSLLRLLDALQLSFRYCFFSFPQWTRET